jgi:WD40 repeat protein
LWSGGEDGAIFAWDVQRANTLVHRASATADYSLPFDSTDMVIAPDGRHVGFNAGDDQHLEIRDVATGQHRPAPGELLAFSPNGERFLTVFGDPGVLRVSDANTGVMLAESEEQTFAAFPPGPKAAFTPDGRRVVAIQKKEALEYVVVLDATTLETDGGKPVLIGDWVRAIGVTTDGKEAIVVVSIPEPPDTEVVLVDLTTRRIVRSTPVDVLGDPFQSARNSVVGPDGRTAGLGNLQGDLGIVNALTGDVTTRPRVHNGRIESVAIAPDGNTFITTGLDGAVYLWETATQRLLASMAPLGADQRLRARFITADRVMLAYGTGEILEWNPRPDAWEAYACKVAGRNLTKAEWDELFPGQVYRVTCPQNPSGA